MTRGGRLVLFGLGGVLFALLVHQAGGARLWNDATRAGWFLLPIVLLYGVVHLAEASAWRLLLSNEPGAPGFPRLLAIHISGTAFNYLTPMINAGGEPFKIASLAPGMGMSRATGAVLLAWMVRALGSLWFWLAALVLGLVLLPRTAPVLALIGVGIVVTTALIALILNSHREGFLERVLTRSHRVPLLRGLARRFESQRESIAIIDRQIAAAYHERPRHLFGAVALQFAGRAIFAVELCLVGLAVGQPVSYGAAFVITGLEALVGNLIFVVPFELGTREGATMLLFQQLGYPIDLGLFAAVVNRFRDLTWIAVGLVIWGAGGRKTIPVAGSTEGAAA